MQPPNPGPFDPDAETRRVDGGDPGFDDAETQLAHGGPTPPGAYPPAGGQPPAGDGYGQGGYQQTAPYPSGGGYQQGGYGGAQGYPQTAGYQQPGYDPNSYQQGGYPDYNQQGHASSGYQQGGYQQGHASSGYRQPDYGGYQQSGYPGNEGRPGGSGPSNRRNVIIVAVAAVLALAVAIPIALIATKDSKDDPPGPVATSTPSASATTSASASPTPTATPTRSATPSPTPTSGQLTARQSALLATLDSSEMTDCEPRPDEETRNIDAALYCSAPNGQLVAAFGYRSEEAYTRDIEDRKTFVTDEGDCADGAPDVFTWNFSGGPSQGTALCYYAENNFFMFWSYNSKRVAFLALNENSYALHEWWLNFDPVPRG